MDFKDIPLDYKVFNDCVHGHIKLHPLCVKIMDTPEFQRLRNLKQMGPTYYVYPGGCHNRFEHSLGVCYLAGQMVEALRRNNPGDENIITDEEKLCIEIAGLCHDVGHGPFSHTWEHFLKRSNSTAWKHEQSSCEIFRHIIKNNNLEDDIKKYLENFKQEEFIDFIQELIEGDGKLKEDKKYLYQIISNKSNGIDVDKWDYLLRDGLQLNIKFMFNCHRLLQFCRVLDVNDKKIICFRNKEVQNIYDMFLTRAKLHNRAYRHHVVEVIEEMMIDGFIQAEKEGYTVGGSKLSEAHTNVETMTKMTDHIFYDILYSDKCEKASRILQRILKRDLYTIVGCKNFSKELAESRQNNQGTDDKITEYRKTLEDDVNKLLQSVYFKKLENDSFVYRMITLDLGVSSSNPEAAREGKLNPFRNIYFFDKNENTAKEIDWKNVPLFPIPEDYNHRVEGLIMYKNKEREDPGYKEEEEMLKKFKSELYEQWNSKSHG